MPLVPSVELPARTNWRSRRRTNKIVEEETNMPHYVSSRDEAVQNMSDISSDFGSLRDSALRKASRLSSAIDKVTIGPESIVGVESSWADNRENEKNTCNVASDDFELPAKAFKDLNISTRSSLTFSKKKILLENELQRREDVRRLVNQRKRQMEKTEKELQENFAIMQKILALKRENDEREELARLEAEEEKLAQQSEMRRKHEQQLQAQRFQERKERLEREAEEHRKTREREELISRITPLRMCFREKCRDISTLSKACKDRNSAAVVLAPLANKLKELSQQMESINERARTGEISTTDLNIAENVVWQSEDVLNVCKSEIARIDALFDEEIARREYEMRQAEAQAQAEAARLAEGENQQPQNLQEQIPQPPGTAVLQKQLSDASNAETNAQSVPQLPPSPPNEQNTNVQENVASPTDSSSVETAAEETDAGYSDFASLQMYMNTHLFLTNYAASYQDLAKATTMKKFRLECQKATTSPVNAISGTNSSHLKDRYDTLRSFFMGKSSPNITQHPQGLAFCKDVLAKTIVSQGEQFISDKPEMAFPVAAVAVALWNDYPDIGDLLIAHFRRACPYILPVFLPRLQGQTDEEYYKSLGYKYSEGSVVEEQEKYVKRMSGLMRLYASIIVTRQRRGVNAPHPHGIKNAWRWLAVILNADPRPDLSDVCATLILDVLEVAGNALWQTYPRQFPKMLMALASQYYPQMQNDAGIGVGPLNRLEQFLKNCITEKSIPPPKGQLAPNFW